MGSVPHKELECALGEVPKGVRVRDLIEKIRVFTPQHIVPMLQMDSFLWILKEIEDSQILSLWIKPIL